MAYIFIRGEFHKQAKILERALKEAYHHGVFGQNGIFGSRHKLECYVHRGAGAYICGEETALLESVEGKRGIVRAKPPLPAISGLFGRPTVINNVLTFAAVLACALYSILLRRMARRQSGSALAKVRERYMSKGY